MTVRLSHPVKTAAGQIILPASKSISNRLLIINALSGGKQIIRNLSDSEDTSVLVRAIRDTSCVKDTGLAGTAMRFMTAYLAVTPGRWLLTGAERMKERPVGKLVDTLMAMGADIRYKGKHGYPPLEINGRHLQGGTFRIDSNISSQFISALLLIAPTLKNGLKLELGNMTISSAYIKLTLAIMAQCGIRSEWDGNVIRIEQQEYLPAEITVEPDWTAASYWYAIASLAESVDLKIRDLNRNSVQGDSIIPALFSDFGVRTEFINEGVHLTRSELHAGEFNYDFTDNPDLVQTFAVLCSLHGIRFRMDGTGTLRIKETDRIRALVNELKKFGVNMESSGDGSWIKWDGKKETCRENIEIETYNDHRMAMAFAMAAWKVKEIIIRDPQVVNKSYPGFWDDLRKTGCLIT
jgi:3-phosphoshikimate 1-carboxyvinyltransferase